MFGHVMVGARDLARMGAFYDAALLPLGLRRRWKGQEDGGPPIGWAAPGSRLPASAGNSRMVVFLAPEAARRGARAAALAPGGTDEGAPSELPRCEPGCYGACLRDAEGNKLHVVRRGDVAVG